MFDHGHYVPILRWKQAEWVALGKLKPADKALITPLVEITPRSIAPRKKQPTLDAMLAKNAVDIWTQWGSTPSFIDLVHLDPTIRTSSGAHPLAFIAGEGRRRGLSLIPVTGLGRDPDYQKAVAATAATDGRGVCLRLFAADMDRPRVAARAQELLAALGVKSEKADLLVDLQVVAASAPQRGICSRLPHLASWRSFTLAGGAFPPDLQGLPLGRNMLPRFEWQAWRALIDGATRLPRRPAFADYAIQHPIYAEPPERANFSASIRYTTADSWLVMRGRGFSMRGAQGSNSGLRMHSCCANLPNSTVQISATETPISGKKVSVA